MSLLCPQLRNWGNVWYRGLPGCSGRANINSPFYDFYLIKEFKLTKTYSALWFKLLSHKGKTFLHSQCDEVLQLDSIHIVFTSSIFKYISFFALLRSTSHLTWRNVQGVAVLQLDDTKQDDERECEAWSYCPHGPWWPSEAWRGLNTPGWKKWIRYQDNTYLNMCIRKVFSF